MAKIEVKITLSVQVGKDEAKTFPKPVLYADDENSFEIAIEKTGAKDFNGTPVEVNAGKKSLLRLVVIQPLPGPGKTIEEGKFYLKTHPNGSAIDLSSTRFWSDSTLDELFYKDDKVLDTVWFFNQTAEPINVMVQYVRDCIGEECSHDEPQKSKGN